MKNSGSLSRGEFGKSVGRFKEVGGGERGRDKDVDRGDFNAKTGKEGGEIRGEEEEKEEGKSERRSKDVKINGEGRRLVEFVGGLE